MVIGWNKAVITPKLSALLSFPFPCPLAKEQVSGGLFFFFFLSACIGISELLVSLVPVWEI